MVSKGQGKRIGWTRWRIAEELKITEEHGKYGSLNLLFDSHRFLKYRKGSITQFRNQGIVFQFACKNRKKYGCRAVIERIEFVTGQPKMYRISNNLHCDDCRNKHLNKMKQNDENVDIHPVKNSNKMNRAIPSNFNRPPPHAAVELRRKPYSVVNQEQRRRIDDMTTKEVRKRMYHLRKEYNYLYQEYQKRKFRDEMRKRKKQKLQHEWYQIPVPPNRSQTNFCNQKKQQQREREQEKRREFLMKTNRTNNNEVQYNFDNNEEEVHICEEKDSTPVMMMTLPKINSLLSPELKGITSSSSSSSCDEMNKKPEGYWDYYSSKNFGKRYLLN